MKHFGKLLKHYLLISLTLAFISGIILQQTYPFAPLTAIFLCILLLIPVLFPPQRNKPERHTLSLLLAVVLLGFLHAANFANQALQEKHIFSRISQEEDSVLTGTLYSMPLFDGTKSTVIIKSRYLRLQDEEYFSPVQGLIQLRLKAIWPPSFVPGDELVIRTRLSRPYHFGNPGSFDYPAFLDSKNIKIVGRISSTAHIHALEKEASWQHSLTYLPERIRLLLKETINNTLPQQQAGLYRALLIGDRSGLDKKQLESFKASGVFHILAISGLHLSIVASCLFVIFYWLARRSECLMLRLSCKKLALLATIPPLCGYSLLAGTQTPVLRALIMVVIFILSFCMERKRSPFTTLSFAALLILLINPKTLFSVSFQLSFAAVASLIFIFPRLIAIVQPKNAWNTNNSPYSSRTIITRWIAAALLVSSVATIGTAPLLINSFNRISTVGPFANLILEPLLCLWSLPIGLLSIPILFISPSLGGWILQIGGTGITAAMEIADFLAGLGFSILWLPTPSPALIALYYISLCFCFLHFAPKKSLVLFIAVCVLFFFPPHSFLKNIPQNLN